MDVVLIGVCGDDGVVSKWIGCIGLFECVNVGRVVMISFETWELEGLLVGPLDVLWAITHANALICVCWMTPSRCRAGTSRTRYQCD